MTKLRAGKPTKYILCRGRGKRFYVPYSVQSGSGYEDFFPRELNDHNLMLSTLVHLVPTLRMVGIVRIQAFLTYTGTTVISVWVSNVLQPNGNSSADSDADGFTVSPAPSTVKSNRPGSPEHYSCVK